jgi:oligoendopeptidase F
MSSSAPDRWSLDSWFSHFGSADYAAFKALLVSDVGALKTQAAALSGDSVEIVRVINALESLADRLGHLSAYLGCLSADNANDEAVKADEAWISTLEAESTKLQRLPVALRTGGAE